MVLRAERNAKNTLELGSHVSEYQSNPVSTRIAVRIRMQTVAEHQRRVIERRARHVPPNEKKEIKIKSTYKRNLIGLNVMLVPHAKFCFLRNYRNNNNNNRPPLRRQQAVHTRAPDTHNIIHSICCIDMARHSSSFFFFFISSVSFGIFASQKLNADRKLRWKSLCLDSVFSTDWLLSTKCAIRPSMKRKSRMRSFTCTKR